MTDYERLGTEYPAADPLHHDPIKPLRELPPQASYVQVREALKAFGGRLNGDTPAERALIRNEALSELKRVRPGDAWADAIDAAMAEKRPPSDLQGSALAFKDPEPWPDPVDGAELLEEICVFVRKFLTLPPGADFLLAAFVVYAYAREAFRVAPYLVVHSPAPQCGKTRVLEVIELLAHRPWRVIKPSTAVLFRVIEQYGPCLLLDEAEVVNTKTPAGEDLCALLQSGYRFGSTVPRCVGDNQEIRTFSTYGPKVFALVGRELPPALFDRCIPITMERRQRDENAMRFRADRLESVAYGFRRRAARWAADNRAALAVVDVPPLEALSERQEEVWEPLLAIGLVAGGSWYGLLRDAADRLSGGRSTTTAEVDLLLDIRSVFEAKGVDRVRSADLASALNDLEGHRWAEWNRGKGITANEVARKLRGFSVTPGTVRFGSDAGDTAKGYRRDQFIDSWGRYAPTVTASQPSNGGENLGTVNRHTEAPSRGQIVEELGSCDDVTAGIPQIGGEG